MGVRGIVYWCARVSVGCMCTRVYGICTCSRGLYLCTYKYTCLCMGEPDADVVSLPCWLLNLWDGSLTEHGTHYSAPLAGQQTQRVHLFYTPPCIPCLALTWMLRVETQVFVKRKLYPLNHPPAWIFSKGNPSKHLQKWYSWKGRKHHIWSKMFFVSGSSIDSFPLCMCSKWFYPVLW